MVAKVISEYNPFLDRDRFEIISRILVAPEFTISARQVDVSVDVPGWTSAQI